MELLSWTALFLLFCKAYAQERYQAEDGLIHNAKIKENVEGFDGSGFIDYSGMGGYVEWTINIQNDGDYEISIGYASANSRPLDLEIDSALRKTYAIQKTDTWTNWMTETHTLSLTRGSHTFRLVANNSNGPNLDWIEILSTNPPPPPTDAPTNPRDECAQDRYQAEDGRIHNAQRKDNVEGFDGSGYIDYSGRGGYVEWIINIQNAGYHEVSIGYASPNSRPLDLDIDGILKQTYAIPMTNSWTDWRTETHTLFLTRGSHTFRLVASNSFGPNVDWIEIMCIDSRDDPPDDPPEYPPPTYALGGDFARRTVIESNR
jgi:predicted secreted protein